LGPSFAHIEDVKAQLPKPEQKRKVMYYVRFLLYLSNPAHSIIRLLEVVFLKSKLFSPVRGAAIDSRCLRFTYLIGFVIHGYLGGRTLFTKSVGLALSVGSGLSLGKFSTIGQVPPSG
jgi:hypothetical protein